MHGRVVRLIAGAALLVGTAAVGASDSRADATTPFATTAEADEAAVDAYLYAYPMVLMEVSRRTMTNVETPTTTGRAPMNQFAHVRAFPDPSFTDVVRPNADALYSFLWFDVKDQPLVLSIPDSGGRYYVMQMMDMWTDVFAAPGPRTTGGAAQTIALVGPGWNGSVPAGMDVIRAPTSTGVIAGRTRTNGVADYDAVHAFQDGMKAVPLDAWGKAYTAPRGAVDPKVSNDAPVDQVARMDAATFIGVFAQAIKDNPPHPNDVPIMARMRRLGLDPRAAGGAHPSKDVLRRLDKAIPTAQSRMKRDFERAGEDVNHWHVLTAPVGTYGTAYLRRAGIAWGAIGANVAEDAIYPVAFTDARGASFDSGKKYVMHFTRDQIPPVRGFWSLSMYDDRQRFAENPIHRYALGDRDKLAFDPDGGLTLYLQRESPGKDRESNWLPTPASGGFSLNLRLYWPEERALDGTWSPPPVEPAAQ